MHRQLPFPLLVLLAWTTLLVTVDSSITYCSTVSTGESGTENFSIYQSNGNCQEHCSGSAFGILQGKNCWCSDIAPNKQTNADLTDCSDGCPGFPDDSCGNAAKGLYAYVQLGTPSGTASVSSSTTTSSTKDSTTKTEETKTTSSTTSTFSSVVETHGGQVTTITAGDPGATSGAGSDNQSDDDSESGVSGGAIAGIVVGVVGGIALIVAAIIFFLAKRRQQSEPPDSPMKGAPMGYAPGTSSDTHSHTLSNGSSIPARLPTFTDSRLNTGTLLYPNGRRSSEVSLQDNEDYSRPVLRLTNPD
ncbi:hypothetical protein BJX61DRAFT_552781 [Aspergillus egyptiacus]|nr:hypothetical protein BJX61DRAFT_552781 [Aspergillus egyptiacus]